MLCLFLTNYSNTQEFISFSNTPMNDILKESIVNSSIFMIKGDNDQTYGSGFIFNQEGYALTNFHVVEFSKKPRAIFKNGAIENIRIIETNEEYDLAVIKLDNNTSYPYLPLSYEIEYNLADEVFSIGSQNNEINKVKNGCISDLKKPYDNKNYIEFDIEIISGNSGGPLISSQKVIGIVTYVKDQRNGSGFAINTNKIIDIFKLKEMEVVALSTEPVVFDSTITIRIVEDNKPLSFIAMFVGGFINGVYKEYVSGKSMFDKPVFEKTIEIDKTCSQILINCQLSKYRWLLYPQDKTNVKLPNQKLFINDTEILDSIYIYNLDSSSANFEIDLVRKKKEENSSNSNIYPISYSSGTGYLYLPQEATLFAVFERTGNYNDTNDATYLVGKNGRKVRKIDRETFLKNLGEYIDIAKKNNKQLIITADDGSGDWMSNNDFKWGKSEDPKENLIEVMNKQSDGWVGEVRGLLLY